MTRSCLLSVCLLLAVSCGSTPPTKSDGLAPVIWVQTSEEYTALCHQAYRSATAALEAALMNPTTTAALEQVHQQGIEALPVAVVVDVDETVLDNSPYQAGLVLDGPTYSTDTWKDWVEQKRAKPIGGALAFLNHAAKLDVSVFYVTNRTADLEEATRSNLIEVGFPVRTDQDVILTKAERPEWGSDKTTRRELIAKSHRIVLLIGDDLGDFVSPAKGDLDQRHSLVFPHRARWGSNWIVLPNPLYGSFDRSILHGVTVDDPAKRAEIRRSALKR